MSAQLAKSAIGANFSAAAATYDGWAAVQAPAAQKLVDSLPPGFVPGTALDVGCGTGSLTRRLTQRFSGLRIAGVDLAPAMVDTCRAAWPRHYFLCGDAEDFDAEGNAFDLVASSFAFQWFADKPGTLARLALALKSGGLLALAVPVAGTLAELEAAHREALDRPLAALDYPPAADYVAWAGAAGLAVIDETVRPMIVHYPDALAALKSFKGIGAVFKGGAKPLTPREVGRLTRIYEDRFRGEHGVPVTYQVLTLIAHG